MKKCLVLFAFIVFSSNIFSQDYKAEALYNDQMPVQTGFQAGDSIKDIVLNNTGIQGFTFKTPNVGPILGTGKLRVIGGTDTIFIMKSRKLSVCFPPIQSSNSITIKEILLPAHGVTEVGNVDSIKVSIYSINADTTPATPLSSIATVAITTLKANNNKYTSIKLDQCNNIATNNPYIVLVEWDSLKNDIFGIMATNPANNDGHGEMKTRVFVNDSLIIAGLETGWKCVFDNFKGDRTFDADAAIILIAEGLTGIHKNITSNGLSVYKTRVSMLNKTATVHYGIDKSQNVNITVFNLSGKAFVNSGREFKNAGRHSYTFNVAGLAKGSYYCSITTESNTLTQKITIK